MKQFCALVFALVLSASAMAQQAIFLGPDGAEVNLLAAPLSAISGPAAPAAPPIVWQEDFGNGFPAGWTIDNPGGLCPWVWSDDGTWGFFNGNGGFGPVDPLLSTTDFNGFLICDIDSANNANFGQPSATTYQDISSWFETSSIDLSGHASVMLQFEQAFRFNGDPDLIVEVSNDHVNWTQWNVNGLNVNNVMSDNPDLIELNISTVAANQPTVWIRIGWNASVYYWAIDDMRIIDNPPANDLELMLPFLQGTGDSAFTEWYTQIPKRHAGFSNMQFGASVFNNAGADMPGATFTANVSGPTSFNATSTPQTLIANTTTSLDITSNTFSTSTTGSYIANLSVGSTLVDQDPSDNSLSFQFDVNDTTFSRDQDDYAGNGIWYGQGTLYDVGLRYDLAVSDTVTSLSMTLHSASTAGSVIEVVVWDENFNIVASTGPVVLTAAQIDVLTNFDLPDTPLPAGIYYAGFIVSTGIVAMGVSPTRDYLPATVLNVNVAGAGWTWEANYTPFIRLHTALPSPLCDAFYGTIVSTDASCGNADGAASASGTNGLAPYTYSWSTGANTPIASNLTIGTYTVTITDVNACSLVLTTQIETANAPVISGSTVSDVTCGNDTDGAISVTASGGNPPLTYNWSNGSTGATVGGLAQATYTVTVSDANGCSATGQLSVAGPPPLVSASVGVAPTCAGGTNGSASAIISGGNPPYTYNWLGGSSGQTVSNLASGWAVVAVADASGCTLLDSVNVPAAPGFTASLYVNNVSCGSDSALGLITAQPLGGSAPYTYLWGNGATTNSILDYVPGTYPITVTDGNGCATSQVLSTSLDSVILIVPDSVVNQSAPPGGGDGGIYISTFGGTAPLTYTWSQGGNTEDVGMLFAGNYTVTITDANGCTTAGTFTVGTEVGVHEVVAKANDFLIVPNPNSGQFYIKLADPIHGGLQLDVYSALGRLVLRESHQEPGSTIEVQLSELPAGLYFARLRGTNINQTQKFLLR